MSKKVVVLLILTVLCFLCLACIGVSYWGFSAFSSSITAETHLIKTQNLDYICKTAGNINESDGHYFTKSYAQSYETLSDMQSRLKDVFPSNFNCDNLLPNEGQDLIGALMNGQAISTNSNNGQDTASITFTSNGTIHTLDFVKVDGVWVIDNIT